MNEEKPKVDLNVVQVVASALAAVSSAVLLSTVGVAGTLIGAAVGSVIATVAGAVYTYSLQASRDRVAAAAQIAAMARTNLSRRGVGSERDMRVTALAEPATGEADRPAWRTALAGLNWKRVAALAAGVFLAAMVAIVAFELVAGRPVSVLTGGTAKDSSSRTTLGGGSAEKSKEKPSSGGSETPSDDATVDSSDEATPSEEPTEQPIEEPTEEPTQEPTDEPSLSEEPTPEEELPSEGPAQEPTVAPTEAATPPPAG